MRVPAHHDKIHPRVAAALRARVMGIRDQLVKAVITQHGPRFEEAEQIVRAILDDPWGVRSPQDLATSMGVSMETLGSWLPDSVARPEHFITLVRWLAFEHLVGELRVKPRHALSLVGMRTDRISADSGDGPSTCLEAPRGLNATYAGAWTVRSGAHLGRTVRPAFRGDGEH